MNPVHVGRCDVHARELEKAVEAGRSALARPWEGDGMCRINPAALSQLVTAGAVLALLNATAPREQQATDPKEPGGET